MREGQTPADFHTGREMGTEPGALKAGEADKRGYIRDLDRPQAKAVLGEMLRDTIDHRVALNATETTAKEFHDARIGIHRSERFPILVAPWAQTEARTGQCHKGAPRCLSCSENIAMASSLGSTPAIGSATRGHDFANRHSTDVTFNRERQHARQGRQLRPRGLR
jgi:hypothetical protein